jgi:hypothetical protein
MADAMTLGTSRKSQIMTAVNYACKGCAKMNDPAL